MYGVEEFLKKIGYTRIGIHAQVMYYCPCLYVHVKRSQNNLTFNDANNTCFRHFGSGAQNYTAGRVGLCLVHWSKSFRISSQ